MHRPQLRHVGHYRSLNGLVSVTYKPDGKQMSKQVKVERPVNLLSVQVTVEANTVMGVNR